MRDYLAGATSSNRHTKEVAERIMGARRALGYLESTDGETLEFDVNPDREIHEYKGIKPGEKEKQYRGHETVNGIEIMVDWDAGFRDYTIYFPQIDLGHAWENEEGVSDQLIRVTTLPGEAQKMFKFAKAEAQKTDNVYDLYRKYTKFSETLKKV